MLTTLEIFDAPMCCSTGVCGPTVNPELVRISADVEWLRRQGVRVERHNPAQNPAVFVNNPTVRRTMHERGTSCLPLVIVGETVVASGTYPRRAALAQAVGIEP